jgi:hypothetical protein
MSPPKYNIARISMGKKADDNATPQALLNELDDEFHFDYDPCPLYGKEWMDGLKEEWGYCNFVNPPYSEIILWLQKGIEQMEQGKMSVFLITARTSAQYWRDYVYPYASEIRFVKRGLKFGNHTGPCPMPIAIVIFDPDRPSIYRGVKHKSYSYFVAEPIIITTQDLDSDFDSDFDDIRVDAPVVADVPVVADNKFRNFDSN